MNGFAHRRWKFVMLVHVLLYIHMYIFIYIFFSTAARTSICSRCARIMHVINVWWCLFDGRRTEGRKSTQSRTENIKNKNIKAKWLIFWQTKNIFISQVFWFTAMVALFMSFAWESYCGMIYDVRGNQLNLCCVKTSIFFRRLWADIHQIRVSIKSHFRFEYEFQYAAWTLFDNQMRHMAASAIIDIKSHAYH